MDSKVKIKNQKEGNPLTLNRKSTDSNNLSLIKEQSDIENENDLPVIKEDRDEDSSALDIPRFSEYKPDQTNRTIDELVDDLFKKARKGMIDYKKRLCSDIKNAHIEKQQQESNCDNLSKNPDRWRLIRKRLKFWAMFRIFNQEVKTYGQTVYKHYWKDFNIRLESMRSKAAIFEEVVRQKLLLYPENLFRRFWAFVVLWLFIYTAFLCP